MNRKKQNNTAWKLVIYGMITVLVVLVGFHFSEWWNARRAGFVRYDAFGIEIPTNYTIHGIDVSRYQQLINWESVRDMDVEDVKIGFAFIKATEGNANVDKQFRRNWKRAKDAHIIRGAYHFFLSTKSGRTQAENFIKTVDLEKGDLPPVLDIEQTYGVADVQLKQRAKEWLDIVENHYGVKPVIYTNVDFYRRHLGDEFDEYPLWIAHYLQKKKPRIHRDWHFWQYSETGNVNGIKARVDFNVFNGDSTFFKSILIP